ncbi:MAG: helix-turn-helix domain-containing protein [Mobilitalea sp.]
MVLHNLGNRIREERIRAKLTQEKLAEAVGCNESYIGQIERGMKNPSLEVIVNIANALGCTVDHLLAESFKIDQIDGLVDEALSLLKDRDPEDVRFIITITRLFLDLLDKKAHKKK